MIQGFISFSNSHISLYFYIWWEFSMYNLQFFYLPFAVCQYHIFPNIGLADDTHANYSVFLLTIVQSKFPDLLRCWSSVPHWSSTDASSQFNTKSQWGASLKWDFELSIFIHDYNWSSITWFWTKLLLDNMRAIVLWMFQFILCEVKLLHSKTFKFPKYNPFDR